VSQVVRLPLSRNVGQPDPEADLRLVRGLRDREPWAAAALVDRYLNLVRRVLVRIMGFGDAEHDDLVQEVFTRALQGAHRLTNAGALRAWLTNVAVFTGRETIRRRTRGRWLWFAGDVPDVPAIAADGDVAEAARTVYAILARLPVDERIPFALRAFEGMDLQELAEACGVSIPTVRRRLARAEKRFHSLAAQSESLSPWVQSR
jgi:RNA polymerase sigma-70 factor (ECF subfamily)